MVSRRASTVQCNRAGQVDQEYPEKGRCDNKYKANKRWYGLAQRQMIQRQNVQEDTCKP